MSDIGISPFGLQVFEDLNKLGKPLMEHIRTHSDNLESVLPDDMWDLPKYREMLFII